MSNSPHESLASQGNLNPGSSRAVLLCTLRSEPEDAESKPGNLEFGIACRLPLVTTCCLRLCEMFIHVKLLLHGSYDPWCEILVQNWLHVREAWSTEQGLATR